MSRVQLILFLVVVTMVALIDIRYPERSLIGAPCMILLGIYVLLHWVAPHLRVWLMRRQRHG